MSIRFRAWLPLGLLPIVLLCGCWKNVERSDVPGVYMASHGNGVETLQLNPDGTYTHRFKGRDGRVSTESDHWEFVPWGNDGEAKVALDNFSPQFPDEPFKGRAHFLLGAERVWGRNRLYLSYDLYYYYSQEKTR